jgi:hypothetical protein
VKLFWNKHQIVVRNFSSGRAIRTISPLSTRHRLRAAALVFNRFASVAA